MTTTVTITTHDWPVQVITSDRTEDGITITFDEVEPNSEESFAIWDSRSVQFVELPRPEE